jgi:hypothetical protein
MSPLAQSDGHDAPRLIRQTVPGKAAMVEDVVVGFEDSVRQPVVAYELPDVFDRVELGAFRRQRQQGDIGRDDQPRREMPAGLVKYQHGMGTRRYSSGYLGKVQRHSFGVAAGQDERRALALGRTDGAIDIRRRGSLVLGRLRPCPALGPAAGDAVLLADPRLVLPPQLYGCAAGERRPDRCHLGGEVFLKAGMASASCA